MKVAKKLFLILAVLTLLFIQIGSVYALTDSSQVAKEIEEKTKAKYLNESKAYKSQSLSVEEIAEESNKLVLKLKDIDKFDVEEITEEIVGTYEELDTIIIDIPEGKVPNEILQKYQKNSDIENAYVEPVVKLFYKPIDPYYETHQWNLKKIGMESVWDKTKGDPSVVIAILDTGFGPYEDLENVIKGADVSKGMILEDTYPGQYSYDGGNHGTAIASLIASKMNNIGITGIAPNVSIMPVKVFPDGSDETGSTQVAAGIRWAADNGADIINLSLGSQYSTPLEEEAINYALNKGSIIVAASGNNGKENFVCYPAAYKGVIAVGSTNQEDNISPFSNGGRELDIVAPGEKILLPLISQGTNTYAYYDGTSFSAPTVSAIAALLKGLYPNYSNKMIEQILFQSATNIGIYGWDKTRGYGRLDAKEALNIGAYKDLFDNNDNKGSAKKIYANKNYQEKIYPVKDNDFFTFTLLEPYTISVTATPTSPLQDLVLELWDNNSLLKVSDSTNTGKSETLNYYLKPGKYYINVYDYWGDSSEYEYSLNIEVDDVTPPLIQASVNGKPIINGTKTSEPVLIEINDTSDCQVSVSRNGNPYNLPNDGTFKEEGDYIIEAIDTMGNKSSFNFIIGKQDSTTKPNFIDVPENHWAFEYIENLASKSIINGYKDSTFKPNNHLTRAQAAVMIVKAAGIDYKGKVSNFKDVSSSHWASAHIGAAKETGIINGYGELFKPNEKVTRAQIAVMISKAFSLKEIESKFEFKDVPETHWANKHIEILAGNNIVSGYDDKTYKPNNPTTRAQFSKILSKVMEK